MKSISLNGQSCDVRENLFDALVNLRHENQQRTLWIGAICINQDNMKERNHQASRMGSIYSQAEKVVAWLGLSDEFTVEALGFLQSFDPETESLTGFISKNELADTEEGCRILEGVRSISLRPYWTRLWILQELQLASEAYAQCGRDCVPWELFKGFVADLEFEDPDYPVMSGLKLRENGQKENVSSMSNLMWRSVDKSPSARAHQYLSLLCGQNRRAQCEKEVDKIFGLWALAPVCCQEAIPVNYSLSLDQVLCNVFEHDKVAHHTPSKHLARREGVQGLWGSIFGNRALGLEQGLLGTANTSRFSNLHLR